MLPRLALPSFQVLLSFFLCLLLLGTLACDDGSSETVSPESEAQMGQTPEDATSNRTLLLEDTVSREGSEDGETGPCIPDCDDKFCGDDGCGVLCGICDEGFACTAEAQCEEVCEPQVSTTCVGNATYWVNGCGVADVLKEQCSAGTECQGGLCTPCAPQVETACDEANVVWMDSCGNISEVIETCGEGSLCVEGECVDGENPLSGSFNLTISPNEIAFSEMAISTNFPNGVATLLIDGAGTVTLAPGTGMESIGGEISQFLGSLVSDQFSAGGMFVMTLEDGTSLERSFMIQALFVDSDTFQGTLEEWIIVDGQGPPAEAMRDITGVRALP